MPKAGRDGFDRLLDGREKTQGICVFALASRTLTFGHATHAVTAPAG